MSSNFESYMIQLEEAMIVLRGELYKFSHDKQKKSGKIARKVLSNMSKSAKQLRKMIIDIIKKIPVVKQKMTPERREEVKKKRLDALAASRAAKKKNKEENK